MHYLIGVCLLILNIYFMVRNLQVGLFIYIVFSFLLPVIRLGSLDLTYDLFAFFPILIVLLIIRKVIYLKKIYILIYLYLILLLFSSLISVLLYDTNFNFIAFLGSVRFLLLIIIYSQIINNPDGFFMKVIFTIISVNFFVSIVQLSLPQSVEIFYNLYYRDSLTPLKEVLYFGEFRRAYGTLGSPINLGTISLISFSYFYSKVLANTANRLVKIGILLSVITGLLSLSKTFIIGLPIIFIIGILFKPIIKPSNFSKKDIFVNYLKIIITGIISIIIFLILYRILKNAGLPIDYYLGFISDPLKAFETRYDSSQGLLTLTNEVIKENFLLGVGLTNIKGEFIGDSAYSVLLHDAGILGAILFLLFFMLIFKHSYYNKDMTSILLLFTLLLSGFAFTVIVSEIGSLVLFYILLNIKNEITIRIRN